MLAYASFEKLQTVRIALLYMVKGQISLKQRQAVFKLVWGDKADLQGHAFAPGQ